MSKIIGDKPCPECRKNGHDKTGNHLMIFEDGGAYCNKKEHHSNGKDYVVKKETKKIVIRNDYLSLNQIDKLPFTDLPDRKISQEVCKHYGIRVGYDESTREISEHYYPYYTRKRLVGYKMRKLPKTFTSIGTLRETNEFFGQQKCTGKKMLLVCGGELDAPSAYQMFKYKKYKAPDIVGFPKGENLKPFVENKDFIDRYETIVIASDMDSPGRKVAGEIASYLGFGRVLVMDISENDVSDMLVQNKIDEFISSFYNAKPYRPDSIVSVEDAFEQAIKMPEWGISWPWDSLTKLTYGIRTTELYGLGAGVGIGKSNWAKELINHLVNHHKRMVGCFFLEEPVGKTLKCIAGKFANKPFHVPDADFTQQELIEAVTKLKGKILLYNGLGYKDWSTIRRDIRHMVIVDGIQDIFIDPLTALVSELSASEANDRLNLIMTELSSMAQELDFSAYYFSHLNRPLAGPPHERGGKVHENQFTGSRAMMKWSHYLFGLERNKDPDLEERERNTSNLVLLKDREFGNVGQFPIFYDRVTGTYLEPPIVGDF